MCKPRYRYTEYVINHCFIFILAHYEDLMEDDVRVRYLWKALEKFSNGMKTHYLKKNR